jgi:transcriptional regulator with XRE-family HTH domain
MLPYRRNGMAMSSEETEALATFGRRVRALRSERALTEADLGKLVGITDWAVQKLECGQTDVQLGTLLRLARALDVKPSELVDPVASDRGHS